jgi:hypothetical protein
MHSSSQSTHGQLQYRHLIPPKQSLYSILLVLVAVLRCDTVANMSTCATQQPLALQSRNCTIPVTKETFVCVDSTTHAYVHLRMQALCTDQHLAMQSVHCCTTNVGDAQLARQPNCDRATQHPSVSPSRL